MIRAHRIALKPTKAQQELLARGCGVARFAYNWALAEWKRQHEARKADPTLPAPSAFALQKQLNAIKDAEFPWMREVAFTATKNAIANLGTAFQNFFAKRGKFPQFKKKGVARDSFRFDDGTGKIRPNAAKVEGRTVHVPKVGAVRMRQEVRFQGFVKSAVISRTADRWFVSLIIETPDEAPPAREGASVGVDLGVSALATLSTGEVIEGPKPLRKAQKRLARLSRQMARKQKGSNNRRKAKMKVARLHARVSNIRSNALHNLTHRLTRDFAVIGIEDLNVKGMTKNHSLALSISDMGFFEFRRQLVYKAEARGSRVIVADRFFPSSKTCSDCGYVLEALPLSVRSWVCPNCGEAHDRDHNAALNLERLAAKRAVSACGEEGSGDERKPVVKPASVKQETRACW